jgi:hypothetical protein
LVNRADLKTARLEERQEAAGIDLANAEAKPDATLSAGYTRQDNQFDGLFGFNNSGVLSPLRDRDDILKFGVSIPLRTSRSGAGNIQAARARTSGARLRREYLERNIPSNWKQPAVLPATMPGTAVRTGRRHFFLAYTSPEFVLVIDRITRSRRAVEDGRYGRAQREAVGRSPPDKPERQSHEARRREASRRPYVRSSIGNCHLALALSMRDIAVRIWQKIASENLHGGEEHEKHRRAAKRLGPKLIFLYLATFDLGSLCLSMMRRQHKMAS